MPPLAARRTSRMRGSARPRRQGMRARRRRSTRRRRCTAPSRDSTARAPTRSSRRERAPGTSCTGSRIEISGRRGSAAMRARKVGVGGRLVTRAPRGVVGVLRVLGDVPVEHAADRAFAGQADRAPRDPQQLAGIAAGVTQVALAARASRRADERAGSRPSMRRCGRDCGAAWRGRKSRLCGEDDHRRRWCGGMRARKSGQPCQGTRVPRASFRVGRGPQVQRRFYRFRVRAAGASVYNSRPIPALSRCGPKRRQGSRDAIRALRHSDGHARPLGSLPVEALRAVRASDRSAEADACGAAGASSIANSGRCATSHSRWRPGRRWASWAATARASRRCCSSSPARSRRRPARSTRPGACRRCSSSAAASIRSSPAARTCFSTARSSACRTRRCAR